MLLAPGLRLGYLALSPLLPEDERAALRDALFPAQIALGWEFPDAIMQYSVTALETVTIDMAALAARRDRMLGALEQWGYRMLGPRAPSISGARAGRRRGGLRRPAGGA